MAGLIRCICGHMYDPELHNVCPACGRERKSKTAERPASSTAPKPGPTLSKSAANSDDSIDAGPKPSWIPKLVGAAAALLIVVTLFNSLSGDEDSVQTGVTAESQEESQLPTDALPEGDSSAAASGKPCEQALGQWRWYTGGYVTLMADKTANFRPNPQTAATVYGRWSCDPGTGTYVITWRHGYTDTMKVYQGGQSFRGSNQVGAEVSGTR
ncbi:MAG: hypothetical protein AAF699_04730 [Pseudomonadota bacterium]